MQVQPLLINPTRCRSSPSSCFTQVILQYISPPLPTDMPRKRKIFENLPLMQCSVYTLSIQCLQCLIQHIKHCAQPFAWSSALTLLTRRKRTATCRAVSWVRGKVIRVGVVKNRVSRGRVRIGCTRVAVFKGLMPALHSQRPHLLCVYKWILV